MEAADGGPLKTTCAHAELLVVGTRWSRTSEVQAATHMPFVAFVVTDMNRAHSDAPSAQHICRKRCSVPALCASRAAYSSACRTDRSTREPPSRRRHCPLRPALALLLTSCRRASRRRIAAASIRVGCVQAPPPPSPPRPGAPIDKLQARLEAALSGSFCTVHRPTTAGAVVPLPATAVYVAELTPELATEVEAQTRVVRPPYHLGWLDSVVTGALPRPKYASRRQGSESARAPAHRLLSASHCDSQAVCAGVNSEHVRPTLGPAQAGRRDVHTRASVLLGNLADRTPPAVLCDVSQTVHARQQHFKLRCAGIDPERGRPTLGPTPPAQRDVHTRAAVLLGNMLVSNVTQRLKRSSGVPPVAQDGGVAVVGGGEVIVRQEGESGSAASGLAIEGVLCAAFYDVRAEVYRQYRLVQD
jgi:hypothetical protein